MEIEKVRNEAARLGFFNDSNENLKKAIKVDLTSVFRKETDINIERINECQKRIKSLRSIEKSISRKQKAIRLKQIDVISFIGSLLILLAVILFGMELGPSVSIVFLVLAFGGGLLSIYNKRLLKNLKPVLFSVFSLVGLLIYLSITSNADKSILFAVMMSIVLAICIYIFNELLPKFVNSINSSSRYIYSSIQLIRLKKLIANTDLQIVRNTNVIKIKQHELNKEIEKYLETVDYEYEVGLLARKCSDSIFLLNQIGTNTVQEVNYA